MSNFRKDVDAKLSTDLKPEQLGQSWVNGGKWKDLRVWDYCV